MRIYISGSMAKDEMYVEHFNKAEKNLKESFPEAKVINPADMGSLPKALTVEEILDIDMELIDLSDAVLMLNGWQKSCGANREYGYASALDKTILLEETL